MMGGPHMDEQNDPVQKAIRTTRSPEGAFNPIRPVFPYQSILVIHPIKL